MEQSTAQNPLAGMPHGVNPQGSLPSDYWNSLDPIYQDAHLQAPPQAQQDLTSHQAPMGIGWDHPVFQQQQPPPQQPQQQQTQPQQRSHIPPPTEQNHGIYSIPQSWQTNPLHQPTRGYAVSSQYQPQQQVPPYQQEQITFDSHSLTPSESSSFPQYSFSPNYFHTQQLPVQGSHPQQQHSAEFPTPTPQPALSQYPIPSGYPPDLLNNTIDLTNDFSAESGIPHQTIDPQFLNPGSQVPAQQQGLQNNLLYGNPADLEGNNGRMFDFYQNSISVHPQIRPNPVVQQTAPDFSLGGFPQHQVVIPPKKAGSKKQTQSKKTDGKAQRTKSRSGSPSSSDDSDLEVEEPDEPSLIPAVRPTEPVAAAEYDTLQAVWSPRNKRPAADRIKSALVAFKDVIKVLRDSWKDQVQAMKLAENQGDNDKATKLKQDVALQRRVMDKIVVITMDMGHPMIVEKLGEHPMALAAIYSFLADRFQAADFEGSLTINMLKLLARFATVDEELLQKTNIAKLLPRLVKKGGPTIKELAQKVIDNAAASTKRKQNNAKAANDDSPPKSSGVDSPSADLAGSKRPREGESTNQPATKRMVVTSNPKDAGKSTAAVNGPVKRPVDGASNGKSSAPAARPRPNIAAPKPSSLFGSLSSASKRPGTTNAERAAAAAAAKPTSTKNEEKPAGPPAKPAFSFGDIMADLNKPKETVVAKPTEERPPETEEEKQKRLRKESRRKLRVSWKPDDSLTEVRLFTHDPEEELGPGDGSLRGMGDVKGEGSVLKLHKDIEELEEDDMGGIRETNFHEYTGLSEIEFESKEMKDANFIKRGGEQKPSSPEKAAQDHRESTTLMVFHASPADVPPTPKEPPAPDPDEVVPEEVDFGELPDHVKARQERYYSFVNPKPAAAQPQQPQPATAGGGLDISGLLKLIGVQQQSTPPPQPAPQPPSQAPMSDLERTISMFRQQQAPAVPAAPPVPATQPPAQAMGLQGVLDIMKQMQPQASFSQSQQTQAAMAPNFGAVFSQLAAMNPQGVPPSQPPSGYEDPERKRMRETSQYDNQYDNNQWARGKRTKSNDPKPPKVGLVPCRFWAEGKCRKGENCTFRHDT